MPKTPDFRANRSIPALVSDTRKPKVLAETGWHYAESALNEDVPLINGWANVVDEAPVSWYLSESGEVRFRGKIDGGAPETVVFVLPEGYRPQFRQTFICAMENGGKANVSVMPNGEVIVDTMSS